MTPPKPPIILIHGAFRGGWAWQRVRRLLQAKGFEVFAPSLTGAGERARLLTPEITLGDWTQDIANLLLYEDLSGAVLVGHSQGGIVCQAVAEAAPERIGRLVFIDAPVLRDGECALDAMPAEILAKYGPTPPNAVIPPTPLTPNEFLDTVETAWVNERLTGAPTNPSLETIAVRRSAHLPRHYLSCRQTPPFFPSVFTRRRLEREGVEFTWLDAPHDCPLTHPAQTAEFIETVCVS